MYTASKYMIYIFLVPITRDAPTTTIPKTTERRKPQKPQSLVDLNELKLELSQTPTAPNALPRQTTAAKKNKQSKFFKYSE